MTTPTLLGIDLGTQRLKIAVVETWTWTVLAEASRDVPYGVPQDGAFEHDPKDWWTLFVEAIHEVLAAPGVDPGSLQAAGLSGHMHSTVMLASDLTPVRPAMAWADARSHAEGGDLVGASNNALWNPPTAPYTATKLAWVQRHEPGAFGRTRHVIFPKDYLRWRLTGLLATDYSDASGSLLWDFDRQQWDSDLIGRLGFSRDWFQDPHASTDVAGRITADAARQTGLPEGLPVAAGSGDVAAALNGHPRQNDNAVLINAGTAAQLIRTRAPVRRYHPEEGARFLFQGRDTQQTFAMGALPSAGLSLSWWASVLNLTAPDLDGLHNHQANEVGRPPYFVPYLQGSGTPDLISEPQGAFTQLSTAANAGEMTRAVMEGVAYAIRYALDALGRPDGNIVAMTGGVGRSEAMQTLLARTLSGPLHVQSQSDVSLVGAVAYAAVAAGVADTTQVVAQAMQGEQRVLQATPEECEPYAQGYERWLTALPNVTMMHTNQAHTSESTL